MQTVVDAEHCLILHHEVTQDSDDRKQLEPMAKAAKEQLQQDELTVTADAGYSNGKQFQACENESITVYVPPNRSSNSRGKEQAFFDRTVFTYDAAQDRYQCPTGKWLILKQTSKGDRIYQAAVRTALPVPSKRNALRPSADMSHAMLTKRLSNEWSCECRDTPK